MKWPNLYVSILTVCYFFIFFLLRGKYTAIQRLLKLALTITSIQRWLLNKENQFINFIYLNFIIIIISVWSYFLVWSSFMFVLHMPVQSSFVLHIKLLMTNLNLFTYHIHAQDLFNQQLFSGILISFIRGIADKEQITLVFNLI